MINTNKRSTHKRSTQEDPDEMQVYSYLQVLNEDRLTPTVSTYLHWHSIIPSLQCGAIASLPLKERVHKSVAVNIKQLQALTDANIARFELRQPHKWKILSIDYFGEAKHITGVLIFSAVIRFVINSKKRAIVETVRYLPESGKLLAKIPINFLSRHDPKRLDMNPDSYVHGQIPVGVPTMDFQSHKGRISYYR